MHWINDAVIYNIYPLGCCAAPKENDFKQEYRLDRLYGFIKDGNTSMFSSYNAGRTLTVK